MTSSTFTHFIFTVIIVFCSSAVSTGLKNTLGKSCVNQSLLLSRILTTFPYCPCALFLPAVCNKEVPAV